MCDRIDLGAMLFGLELTNGGSGQKNRHDGRNARLGSWLSRAIVRRGLATPKSKQDGEPAATRREGKE